MKTIFPFVSSPRCRVGAGAGEPQTVDDHAGKGCVSEDFSGPSLPKTWDAAPATRVL